MSRSGIGPWLRTLASAAIAAIGLSVLWSSWPEGEFARDELSREVWTVPVRGAWIPSAPPETVIPPPRAPGPGPVPVPTPAVEPPAGFRTYLVVEGDTLWRISVRELGSSGRIDDIVRANPGIRPDRIRPGDTLLLPVDGGSAPVVPARKHRVAKGETLSGIAVRYRVAAEEIFRANRHDLPSMDRIREGQVLTIPASGERGTR